MKRHLHQQDGRRPRPGHEKKHGMVLYAVIGLLALLTALALVVFTSTRIDFKISRNHIETVRALYQADSGIQCAKAYIERRLVNGDDLPAIAASVQVTPPSGYTFDNITSMTQLSDTNLYQIVATGHSGDAETRVQATVKRAEALILGIFGDVEVGTMPNVDGYSYDGDLIVGLPLPSDSTGEASIGSNENLIIQPNVTLDGRFLIGEDLFGSIGTYPSGWPVEEVTRIDPDPLGAIGGSLAADFVTVQSDNDNDSFPYIINNVLELKNHGTVTMTAGNYYLTEVDIGNHSELLADTSAGPVNIFMTGGFYMGPGSDLNTTGKPSDFRIFSNSSEQIQIKPKGDAKCFIYAPDAEVQMYPIGNFYGAAWAEIADLKPGGNIWIDVSLLKKIKTNRIVILSWKELRG